MARGDAGREARASPAFADSEFKRRSAASYISRSGYHRPKACTDEVEFSIAPAWGIAKPGRAGRPLFAHGLTVRKLVGEVEFPSSSSTANALDVAPPPLEKHSLRSCRVAQPHHVRCGSNSVLAAYPDFVRSSPKFGHCELRSRIYEL